MKRAKQFFKSIEPQQEQYKLINGLFIVKYIDKEISVYIGELIKGKTARNKNKNNLIRLSESQQKFNVSKKIITNARGDIWKKANISLIEKPISEVLI